MDDDTHTDRDTTTNGLAEKLEYVLRALIFLAASFLRLFERGERQEVLNKWLSKSVSRLTSLECTAVKKERPFTSTRLLCPSSNERRVSASLAHFLFPSQLN